MQNPDALVPAETRSTRRRTVLALACALVASCLVITFWPAGEPTAPPSPPAAIRDVAAATPATTTDASAPRRDAALAKNEERDSRPPDDGATLRIEFDPFDAWVAGRPVTWLHFGPGDGSAREIFLAPITVRTH